MRHPTWDWKALKSAELWHFNVAYATREYIQNQVAQILKGIESREWTDWVREDLRESTTKERLARKKALIKEYPGLLTGPHGGWIRTSKDWLPTYVLHAHVKAADLLFNEYGTDLCICTTVWTWKNSVTGLVFFNNHLDSTANFETSVLDGKSTSRKSNFAVGEKGKGFIMATQWFWENAIPLSKRGGNKTKMVSFRVGHQLGELKCREKDEKYIDPLRVAMNDLTPVTVEELEKRAAAECNTPDDDDSYSHEDEHMQPTSKKVPTRETLEKACTRLYNRRHENKMSEKLDPESRDPTSPPKEVSFVQHDEVVVTVLGLPEELAENIEEVFLGIYGIIPPSRSWRIPNTLVLFFPVTSDGTPLFYNRDQLVPDGPHLLTMGINYFGVMTLTADRQSVIRNGGPYKSYQDEVSRAADIAFQTDEELAVELALEILAPKSRGAALPLRDILKPGSNNHGSKYKAAFDAAWRRAGPNIPSSKDFFPFLEGSSGDREVIEEYGMTAQEVDGQVLKILRESGAFGNLEDYANGLLNNAPHSTKPRRGIERFRHAISRLLPVVSTDSIIMKQFPYGTPVAAWDKSWRTLSVAEPRLCDQPNHEDKECLCWVGPYLWKATKVARKGQKAGGLGQINDNEIWRAYMDCMEGVVDMQEPSPPSFSISRPTSPAMSCSSDTSFTQQELGYPTLALQNEEMPTTSSLTRSNVGNKVTQKLDAVPLASRLTERKSWNSGPLGSERAREMPTTACDSEDVIPPSSSVLPSLPPLRELSSFTQPLATASTTSTIQTTPTLHSPSARSTLADFDGWMNKITESFRREHQQNVESGSRFEELQAQQAAEIKLWQLKVSELEKLVAAKDDAISEWKTKSETSAKRIEELETAELALGTKLQDVIAQHCAQIQTQISAAGSKRRRVETEVD